MNNVNPYEPLHAVTQSAPPLVMQLRIPRRMEIAGGVPGYGQRVEDYVLLSALPDELRQRVIVAIQALQSSI